MPDKSPGANPLLTAEHPQFNLLETLLWEPEQGYFLLEPHLRRLVNSAKFFNRTVDHEQVWANLQALGTTLGLSRYRVRVLVANDGQVTLQATALQPSLTAKPWRVALAKRPVNSLNPFLYHKTTHRQVYEQALAAYPHCNDVLLWNEREEITEACVANVVFQFGRKLVTPPVNCGLLAGTYRNYLLAQNVISKQVVTVDAVKQSHRIYLINSVRRWVEAIIV